MAESRPEGYLTALAEYWAVIPYGSSQGMTARWPKRATAGTTELPVSLAGVRIPELIFRRVS
jgi:hypothetical protein